MSITLQFSPADLGRCRFAISPAFETLAAIRVLTGPQHPGPHQRWWEGVRASAAAIDLRPITMLQPRRGYTPDFLAPPPRGPESDFDSELDRIAATPPAQVLAEVRLSLADTPGAADSEIGTWLLADPVATLARLTELIRRSWQLLLEPVWPRIRSLLDADIAFQTRRLGEAGLDRMFAELHPALRWRDNVLSRAHGDEHRDLAGAGLVLVPSAFKWDQVVIVTAPPWQPTVIYPARGLDTVWHTDGTGRAEALAKLIGRTRALLLSGLTEAAATSRLAHRFALAPSTVSAHLAVLREAGLVTSHRHGHEIRYRRTPLGTTMVTGEGAG